VLHFQRVNARRYFDAAGIPGRTLDVDALDENQETAGR
jgi:hypothetical protein